MRVLVDTNVLFSALLFPDSKPAQALLHVIEAHELVLCDRNVLEVREVVRRKRPQLLPAVEELFTELSYELAATDGDSGATIRDPKDQPILDAAIASGVDMVLTGDKDFLSLDLEHPKCLSPARFLCEEGIADGRATERG